MRILITGITGFAGRHLTDFISGRPGAKVYGISRGRQADKKIYACDLRDAKKISAIVKAVKPDRVFHLAAQSSVQLSWKEPSDTFEQNLMGTLNLLEAVRQFSPRAKVQIAGSAQEYGVPPKKTARLDERAPVNPQSPYAVSKVAQDLLASQYGLQYGLQIVRTRAFNHIGPGQSPDFLAASLARQIARIEAGKQNPVILAGNLDTVRDYTDVRDMARAYWLALEKGQPGEVYNIASGRGYSARQILNSYLELSRVKITVKADPARMRANDLSRLVGDARKFTRRTGWKPRIPVKTTLLDTLNYWRQKVRHE